MSSAVAPMTPSPSSAAPASWTVYKWLRVVGAVACVGAGLFAFAMWLAADAEAKGFSHNPNVLPLSYTDPVKAAIAQKVDSSKSLLQASFIVFAVLWGVILAKKGEGKLVLGDWPELAMFFAANFCFLISWTYYVTYSDAMAAVQARADSANPEDPKEQVIPDFRTKEIDVLPDRQYTLFVLALAATGVTLLSAHLLKEASTCPAPSPAPSPASP